MLSIKNTARLPALSILAVGLTVDGARAGDGRGTNRTTAHQGANPKIFLKTSYTRRHKATRRPKVVQSRHPRWQGHPRRWTPPGRGYRKIRRWARLKVPGVAKRVGGNMYHCIFRFETAT